MKTAFAYDLKHPLWTYPLRFLTAGMTGWETFAIIMDDDRFPTFSKIAGTHRWFAPTLLILLGIHLWWPWPRERLSPLVTDVS